MLGICVLVHVRCFIYNDVSVHVCACMAVLCIGACMLFHVYWNVSVRIGVCLLVCVFLCKCWFLRTECLYLCVRICVNIGACILVDAYVVQASCVNSASEYVCVGAYVHAITCMCMCININMLLLFIMALLKHTPFH